MGSLSGEGIMIYPDGRRYEGNFKENEHNGFGIMEYPSGDVYGEGSKYAGQWKKNKRHGQGVMTYLDDGRVLKGLFRENIYIKE